MIDLRKLRVQPGEPVWPAWQRLLEWAGQFRLITGNGIRLTRTPQGTYVVADVPSVSFAHPFKVALGSGEVSITPGTVEDLTPTIGKTPLDADPAPALRITGKPNKDGVSWVAVQVTTKDGGTSAENAQVVHVTTLDRPEELVGIQPLAMLRWVGNEPRDVLQIVHHNLGHYYVAATETRGSRHLFWAK